MRIAIIASRSRGDVEPYLALGKGLVQAGNLVRFVTYRNYEALVKTHGLEFWPVEGNVQDVAQSAEMKELLERGNFLAIMSHMGKEAERGSISLAQAGLAACQGTDLILAGVGGLFVGLALAEKLRLPFVQAPHIPFTPTSAYPSFVVPELPVWLGGAVNRASYYVAQQVMWQTLRKADGRARREVLDLPPASFWGPYRSDHLRHSPILYGCSPSVIPPPSDWGQQVHVTGYWFLDPPADWSPPPDLVAFLEAGPPPIYIGFGSMSNRKPEETMDLVLEALARTDQRAIVLSGWEGLRKDDLPDSVRMVASVPHAWLFPRTAAVVHQGGGGTMAAGLRAGVPSAVIPFFGDQPFWGRRVADLGVGPAPIPRKKLTAERLAQAIALAVHDKSMRHRAAELGARIQAEDGIGRAVAVLRSMDGMGAAQVADAAGG